MDQNNYQQTTPSGGNQNYGYSKRPLWQWIVLYVVIGAIAYGAIYYFYFYNKGGYSYAPQTPGTQNTYAPTNSTPEQQPTTTTPMMTTTTTTTTTTTPANPPTPTTTPTPTVPATVSIEMRNYAFNPASISIRKGTTVTWKNYDQVSHTVTGYNGGPDSSYLAPGETYSYTFNSVGTFAYHCIPHAGMQGTVQVTN